MFSMDRKFKFGAGGWLLAGVIATTAFGADAPAPGASAPEHCQGGHRDVDLATMKERAAKEFAAADTNADGKISEAEFLAFKPSRRGGPGAGMRMGKAGPGMGMHEHGPAGGPTPQAREALQAEWFSALDTDHNGQLSATEFSKARETMHSLMKAQMFKRLDKNGDGELTKDEFPPFAQKMSAMDTNADGTVTHDEMKAARAAKGSQASKPQN